MDPEVFNPEIFFSSQWFAQEIAQMVKEESLFIEVGCGTGIVSINIAKENKSLVVHATDINPRAAQLTHQNAIANKVVDRITTYCGDVLDAILQEIKADSIF